MISVFTLVYLIAATWRISNLIANKEKGPFRIVWTFHLWVRRLARKYPLVKKSEVLEGLECEYCLSIWFGTLFTVGYLVLGDVFLWTLLPLVISTGVIVLKHIVFLIKSVDKRFDQQNQRQELLERQELLRTKNPVQPVGSPEWDTLVFERNQLDERR